MVLLIFIRIFIEHFAKTVETPIRRPTKMTLGLYGFTIFEPAHEKLVLIAVSCNEGTGESAHMRRFT